MRQITEKVIFPIDRISKPNSKTHALFEAHKAINNKAVPLSSDYRSQPVFICTKILYLRRAVNNFKDIETPDNRWSYDFANILKNCEFDVNDPVFKSKYLFSELGISSVEKLIKYSNVEQSVLVRAPIRDSLTREDMATEKMLRNHFADNVNETSYPNFMELQEALKVLKNRFPGTGDIEQLADIQTHTAFKNTLALKVLLAVNAFHKQKFGHNDLKPANIVLCLNKSGAVDVKLIDLDFMTELGCARLLPDAGTETFMPPEANQPEADGSISYTTELGDSYATGMSIRMIAGFSETEVGLVNQLQQLDEDDRDTCLAEVQLSNYHWAISDDTKVQSCFAIAAKLKVAPHLITLNTLPMQCSIQIQGKDCLVLKF